MQMEKLGPLSVIRLPATPNIIIIETQNMLT